MNMHVNTANDGSRDIEQAIATLGERLPSALIPLSRLAFNYRWAWTPGALDLFRTIDPELWRHCNCNPRDILEAWRESGARGSADYADWDKRIETGVMGYVLDPVRCKYANLQFASSAEVFSMSFV